jgi:hypothetical protein
VSSYLEYVAGRTVAVVGPAPAPYDQSAEVEAHDIVLRCSPFSRAVAVPGYGTRTDVGIYNGTNTRRINGGDEQLIAGVKQLKWSIYKVKPYPYFLGNARLAHWPTKTRSRQNPNQVTLALSDLTHFEPASVTVFGADFFTGPMGEIYDPAYHYLHAEVEDVSKSMRHHDQRWNRAIVKAIRKRYGWPNGDARYQAVLDMPDDEFDAIQDRNWGVPRPLAEVYPHVQLPTL